MKQLFPPEIIEYSAESHFSKRNKSTSIIYIAVMLFIAAIIAILPVVKVEITTQSRGIVKSAIENNQLQAVVYGEIEDVFLYENKDVGNWRYIDDYQHKKLKEQKESYKRNLLEKQRIPKRYQSILSYRQNY
jgi:HlyD family secretion protein